MRSTSKINNSNSLLYITRNFQSLSKVSTQVSLQQQVVDLEDDPLSANIGVRMLNIISKAEQYNRNIKTGIGSLKLTDSFLTSCKGIMDKVKKISVGSANDPSDRSAASVELNEILKSLVSAGNAHDGSRYILGGTHTTTPPFTIVNGRYVNYTGNDEKINILVDNNTNMHINATGTDAYGNMITKIPSRDMNPDINLATDNSTRLSDLNGGDGVPKGKIKVYYSAYPEGIEIDLSNCDTLEDVKDTIEQATLQASRDLDPAKHSWLNPNTMDWHDLQDRYVKVTMNPEHNGISLQEYDLGEPLPEPNIHEQRKGVTYSGKPGYVNPGDLGAAQGQKGETTVHDKPDYINGAGGTYYAPLRVDDFANNRVASSLGIKGSAKAYNPTRPDKVMDGFLHGKDLNPILSDRTLLADLEGYNDSVYTLTNGAKPGSIVISETSQDKGNVFNNWQLSGLSKGKNTGANGELYARAINRGTPANPEIYVELYTCPIDKAKASDLVATGLYTEKEGGGTVILQEANNSGLSGTVGIVLPSTVDEATVNLTIDFGASLQASVHVPAFIEEQSSDGLPRDIFNIASGWNIRGLDKPPANSYDRNHPASTDPDGDVGVNYRYDGANNCVVVELFRPSYSDQPAKIIASGTLSLGVNNAPPNMANTASGRVELIGAPGFEGVKGSVYLEIPSGANFSVAGSKWGTATSGPTSVTYQTQADSDAGTIVFGGAVELQANQAVSGSPTSVPPNPNGIKLAGPTTFKKGQEFTHDVHLPDGGLILAGTVLDRDITLPKGVTVFVDELVEGTVLAEGQEITFTTDLAAGTVIPRGSYYKSPPSNPTDGFAAGSMGMTVTHKDPYTGASVASGVEPIGYDLRATFATVEDFNRAVEEAGIYVTSQVSADGKSLEFKSSLAGAYLTVSEDTDCYEQMGDIHQQLTGLDLNGLIKGVNSDKNGNVHTEVVYHPPEPNRTDGKALLIDKDGKQTLIDAGYYVRVYSDPDQLKLPYQDRDNTLMVAEGFVPAGEWNPVTPYDQNNPPFLPKSPLSTLGLMNDLVLEERNESGVWGTVDLDYYGDKPTMTTNDKGEPVYTPYDNSNITVFPGGLRPEGSRHTTVQEWDMYNIIPGLTCDYSGTYHGTIARDDATTAGLQATLYRDGSHSVMTAKSDPDQPIVDGKVVFYEVDRHGNFLNKDGKIIQPPDTVADYGVVVGTMTVARNDLLDGQSDDFKLTTGAVRNYGQEREENVFSTINDIMDAIHQDDLEKIHDMLGNIQKDIDHILVAVGDVGARQQRMQLLSERHADDIVRFKTTLTSRVGMDDQALAMAVMNYQAATNAYQAAMQVSASVMQMSLLNYL